MRHLIRSTRILHITWCLSRAEIPRSLWNSRTDLSDTERPHRCAPENPQTRREFGEDLGISGDVRCVSIGMTISRRPKVAGFLFYKNEKSPATA